MCSQCDKHVCCTILLLHSYGYINTFRYVLCRWRLITQDHVTWCKLMHRACKKSVDRERATRAYKSLGGYTHSTRAWSCILKTMYPRQSIMLYVPDILKNYRPITNLQFLSKLIEGVTTWGKVTELLLTLPQRCGTICHFKSGTQTSYHTLNLC